jgi:hypothetical protein
MRPGLSSAFRDARGRPRTHVAGLMVLACLACLAFGVFTIVVIAVRL